MYVYLVCAGDVNSHRVVHAFLSKDEALLNGASIADAPRKFEFLHTFESAIGERVHPEIALWVHKSARHSGRLYGYISVEQHKLLTDEPQNTKYIPSTSDVLC